MLLELARMSWGQYLLGGTIGLVCFLLIVIILLQKGRGGGLSSAFGGGSSSAFGAKTGDVFTWITVAFAALFLLLAVVGNYVFRPGIGPSLGNAVTASPGTNGAVPPLTTQPTQSDASDVQLEPITESNDDVIADDDVVADEQMTEDMTTSDGAAGDEDAEAGTEAP